MALTTVTSTAQKEAKFYASTENSVITGIAPLGSLFGEISTAIGGSYTATPPTALALADLSCYNPTSHAFSTAATDISNCLTTLTGAACCATSGDVLGFSVS